VNLTKIIYALFFSQPQNFLQSYICCRKILSHSFDCHYSR
jgi:hypothetical protein